MSTTKREGVDDTPLASSPKFTPIVVISLVFAAGIVIALFHQLVPTSQGGAAEPTQVTTSNDSSDPHRSPDAQTSNPLQEPFTRSALIARLAPLGFVFHRSSDMRDTGEENYTATSGDVSLGLIGSDAKPTELSMIVGLPDNTVTKEATLQTVNSVVGNIDAGLANRLVMRLASDGPYSSDVFDEVLTGSCKLDLTHFPVGGTVALITFALY